MAVDLKALTPDTSLPTTGFLFGADSQSAASPSVYSAATVSTAVLNVSGIYKDAVNAFALRGDENAQVLRVFSTYTDATTNAYGGIGAGINLDGTAGSTDTLYIGSQKTGSPTVLSKLSIQVNGTTALSFNGTSASFPGTVSMTGTLTLGNDLTLASGSQVTFGSNGALRFTTANNLRLSNSGATDFGLLQFGGTSNSFPALKRSTTTLQARLADDSAFCPIQGKLTTDTAYTAGAPTATGYLMIYDSAGTGYKVLVGT